MEILNPAFDYDKYGRDYSGYRRTDPRIAEYVLRALGDAKTVLNVGAGAGSYEPADRHVVAVEPSRVMREQRLARGKAPAVIGWADNLPFDDRSFDASMAMVTIHHWPDVRRGLAELRRVTRDTAVVMTFDPAAMDGIWLAHYFPELIEIERSRMPAQDVIVEALGGDCEIVPVPVPFDCIDGFQEAFYGRPEAFLVKEVRAAQSSWGFLPAGAEEKLVQRLAEELKTGEWDRRFAAYRNKPFHTCALRLVVADVRGF
ncbi:class I SAM-dependent methyltransferase [Paenibacillus sp. TH7-28]